MNTHCDFDRDLEKQADLCAPVFHEINMANRELRSKTVTWDRRLQYQASGGPHL